MSQVKKIVVFGGSGFVGSRIVEKLREKGSYEVRAVSRRNGVDAMDKNSVAKVVEGADGVIISIGSPPLPFVDYQYQYDANGTSNCNILDAAKSRAVLINATMPTWIPRGYRDGKLAAESRALEVGASVLKPSAIYGVRFGIPIPLKPVSWLFQKSIFRSLEGVPFLRGVLDPPVHVDAVADAAIHCLDHPGILKPADILPFTPSTSSWLV